MVEMLKPENLGKRKFRPFVDALIEPAFINATSENKNCSLSSQEFIIALGKTLGERIFKALVEQLNNAYPRQFESFKETFSQVKEQDFTYPVKN